jgi:Ca2+-binding EF-hand superfamily protein
LMARLSKETGFERPELEALWEQWTFMANTEWREDPDELGLAMDRKTFERYLVPSGGYRHITPNLLHDRMFAFYDDNNDDLIGFSEFLRGTAYRKRKDRLRRVFAGYDVDGDGYVNRRDFLRLFRAYYVLFKQMHKDLLDGLDDQVMSSTEVEQLITSRQPLSSLFGREGGFPQADSDRPMMGKVVNDTTGEVHISDGGSRAVNDDTPDTADRQSLLLSLFAKQTPAFAESLFMPTMDNPRPAGDRRSGIEYLNGLLNPPTRISELPALLLGETRDGDDFLVVLNAGGAQEGSSDEHEARSGDENSTRQRENGVPAPGEDRIEHRMGTDGSLNGGEAGLHERELRRASYMIAPGRRARQNARRKLFDRWKRRQFYLDEEEGALPPDDWSDDDDVLAHVNGSTEDSKTTQPPMLSRSRSSSKVRFAEDTDDFDIRSNPSTSSRSIPERWGGMEIPDAERDVGKEVFYQVIQQAFNEILDTLFKAKEDLAVKAAETKEQRDKYRTLYETINLDEEKEPQESPESATNGPKPPQDQSLHELLVTTGYSVDAAASRADDHTGEQQADPFEETDDASETSEEDEIPHLGTVNGVRFEEDEMLHLETADGVPCEAPPPTDPEPHRDPTMPQFRPNSSTLSTTSSFEMVPAAHEGDNETSSSTSQTQPHNPTYNNPVRNSCATCASCAKKSRTSSPIPKPIPRTTLVEWKRLDLAEEEAKARGGWGRLSYDEFERIYRTEEANGSRLDYLGTWIDFCIPYN